MVRTSKCEKVAALTSVAMMTMVSPSVLAQSFATPCPPAICAVSGDEQVCAPPDSRLACSIIGQEPNLEGYGTSSSFGGGPGSEVCTVTNLNNAGSGSLRECVENRNGSNASPVPRVINFSVGGTITLTSDLRFQTPYLTLDGFTAPPPGITIAKAGSGMDGETRIQTWPSQNTCAHDILVRGLRFRGTWGRASEAHSQNADVLNTDGEDLPGCLKNIVIWSNTFVDGQDAVGGFWGSVSDVTFAYNFLLYNHHPQQISHSPGGVIGQERQRFSVHHNIYAYGHERMPNIRGNVWDINLIQNVFHKWDAFGFGGGYATIFRCRSTGCPKRANLIDNHWTSGGVSLTNALDFADGADPAEVYMRGNILPAAEMDAGIAPEEFPNAAPITIYGDREFAEKMFDFIGQRFPTAEEQSVKAEIAIQMQTEL